MDECLHRHLCDAAGEFTQSGRRFQLARVAQQFVGQLPCRLLVQRPDPAPCEQDPGRAVERFAQQQSWYGEFIGAAGHHQDRADRQVPHQTAQGGRGGGIGGVDVLDHRERGIPGHR
ncbi:hypothetical protein ACFPC0_00115 [Streptomyces andamanensis]|uniref:Uncharacterized protein n=1 Tax=Streptomyces andamanensis TaxID=1565035 RepID=A0ABV8T6V3_9ACTN